MGWEAAWVAGSRERCCVWERCWGELLRELGACEWGVWPREESALAPSGSGVGTRWDGGAFPRVGDHGKRTVL